MESMLSVEQPVNEKLVRKREAWPTRALSSSKTYRGPEGLETDDDLKTMLASLGICEVSVV